MFKGKIGIWAIVLVICLGVQCLFSATSLFKKQPINATITSDVDENFYASNYGKKFSKYKLNVTRDKNADTDIVISMTDSTHKINGYTKLTKQFYSPMIIYMRNYVYENHQGLKPDENSAALSIDLYSILIGLENSKTWEDVGLSTKVYDGPIELVIPNEQSPYYTYVKELFYTTLSGGSNQTEFTLNKQVDDILNKCTKVRDISIAMNDYFNAGTKTFYDISTENKAFIGPEFYDKGNLYSNDSKNSLRPIYFFETTCVELDAFLKNEDEVANNYMEYLQKKDKFFAKTRWRVKNCKYETSEWSMDYIDTIPGYIS